MSIVQAAMSLFNERLDTQEGKDKVAEIGGAFIRDRLREVSFMRHVIPPEQVTRADCQRSTKHDSLVKIVDVEPRSSAMTVDFRGEPTAELVRAPRAEIAFFTITSKRFEKTEQELLAYEMPLLKIIEDNTVKDLQEIEDREGIRHVEAGIQARQTETNTNTTVKYNATNIRAANANAKKVSIVKGELALAADGTDFEVRPIQKPDLVNLFKLLDGNRLRASQFLITEVDHDDVLQWTIDDLGSKLQGEMVVDGYKYNTLMGRRVVRTIKTDILRPGNVYCFTDPQFFGKFYILNNTKFYIDKRFNRIMWQSWEDIGMGFINVSSAVKLELYRGSVRPTATDTGYADVLSKAEDDLGAENNRVDSGLYYPHVNQY